MSRKNWSEMDDLDEGDGENAVCKGWYRDIHIEGSHAYLRSKGLV